MIKKEEENYYIEDGKFDRRKLMVSIRNTVRIQQVDLLKCNSLLPSFVRSVFHRCFFLFCVYKLVFLWSLYSSNQTYWKICSNDEKREKETEQERVWAATLVEMEPMWFKTMKQTPFLDVMCDREKKLAFKFEKKKTEKTRWNGTNFMSLTHFAGIVLIFGHLPSAITSVQFKLCEMPSDFSQFDFVPRQKKTSRQVSTAESRMKRKRKNGEGGGDEKWTKFRASSFYFEVFVASMPFSRG